MSPAPAPIVCFLLSLPRSGTTLLAHLLQQHPDILAPPEPWIMLAIEAMGAVDPRHPAEGTLVRTASDEFLGRIDHAAAARALADEVYGQYLTVAHKRLFFDKTPRNWMVLDFIDALYPKASRLVLLRNPYAIAASLKSTWSVPLIPETCPPANAPHLADLILGLPVLAAERHRPNIQIVRYETLVAQPDEEIRRLIAGLGFDPEMAITTVGEQTEYLRSSQFGDRKILETKTIEKSGVDAWQSVLTPEEMQAVTDMVGTELLTCLGYGQEFLQAVAAGVIDKGSAVTERHRRVFRTWWNLRRGTEQAKSFESKPEAERSLLTNSVSVLYDAHRLAESEIETALREAHEERDTLRAALDAATSDRTRLQSQILDREATITDREVTIADREVTIADRDATIVDREATIVDREATIVDRDATIADREAVTSALRSEVAELDQALAATKRENEAKIVYLGDVIAAREAKIAAFRAIPGVGLALYCRRVLRKLRRKPTF